MKNKRRIFLVILTFLILTISSIGINANQNNLVIQPKTKDGSSFDMIIIALSNYRSALQPLIDHKNNHGIITTYSSLNEIYEGKNFQVIGRDNQEKIKYFIKDAIETWGITYVLFVGSNTQVPVRYCYNDDEYLNSPEPRFVSELYYADIYDENNDFSSWDSDGDGIFGEWDGETAEDRPINLTPDVCLGRLACINVGEVQTVVNKIVNYEKQQADPSWFKRIVVVGGDTYLDLEGYEGEIYNEAALNAMQGFTHIKLWASTGKLKRGWDIYKEINKGCGFWYLSGHGNENVWVTNSPDGSQVGKFSSWYIYFLRNQNRLPICLVGGCHNSDFDVVIPNYFQFFYLLQWLRECWSWKLVSKSNGGSIATIGATGLAWYSAEYAGSGTDWLNIHFFEKYAEETNYKTVEKPIYIGQVWKDVLTSYLQFFPIDWETPSGGSHSINAKTVQEWTLLGDPSLAIGGYPS